MDEYAFLLFFIKEAIVTVYTFANDPVVNMTEANVCSYFLLDGDVFNVTKSNVADVAFYLLIKYESFLNVVTAKLTVVHNNLLIENASAWILMVAKQTTVFSSALIENERVNSNVGIHYFGSLPTAMGADSLCFRITQENHEPVNSSKGIATLIRISTRTYAPEYIFKLVERIAELIPRHLSGNWIALPLRHTCGLFGICLR